MYSLNKINLVIVNNPFNVEDREKYSIEYEDNKSIYDYIEPYIKEIDNLVISLNGKIIEVEEAKQLIPVRSDCIAICDSVEKGGKDILRSIAGIALSVWVAGLGSTGIWGIKAGTFAMGLVQAGLMMIGGALINAIFPVASTDSGNVSESNSESTYSWGQLNSIQGQGGALAKTYGTVRTAGTLIASHVSTSGEKQYLNLLYTGGEGVADSVNNIMIDDNPISNYQDVSYEVRLGTNVQDEISYFDYTSADLQLSYALELAEDFTAGSWHTQRTDGEAEALEFTLAFSNGLYYVGDSGAKSATSVTLECQYKKVGETEWKNFGTSYKTHQEYVNSVTGEHYALTDSRIIVDDGRYSILSNYYTDPSTQEQTAIYQVVKKVTVTDYDDPQIVINNLYEDAYYITNKVDNLPRGQYDIRLRCIAKSGHTYRFQNKVYFSMLSGILYRRFSRPNKILVAIKALATDQLSGSQPNVTWEQTVSKVLVYNPETKFYEEKPATNPAWVVYDMFHKTRRLEVPNALGTYQYVTNGCKADRLDYYQFLAWANRCDTMNLTFNYCFDSIADMWEAIKKVETCGRGKVVLKGTTVSCVFDEPKTPVQMFTVANVIQDTFSEEFLSEDARANCVEVTFANKEKNYESDVAVAYGSNWDNEKNKSTQVTLYGCTNYEEAYRYAAYMIRANEYFIRTLSFQADIDSIACQVGDAIYLQSDVFNWGAGGRLEEFTSNSITLNEPVILEAGKNYSFKIRYQDGTLLNKECAPVVETKTYTTVNLSSDFTIMPSLYDIYVFGETSKMVKKVRVTEISRSADSRKKITCAEFDDAIYNESEVIVIPEVVTTPTIAFTNLLSVEDGYQQKDGVHISTLSFSWAVVNLNRISYKTEVQVQRDNRLFETVLSSNELVYNTILENLAVGSTYTFRVRAISRIGTPLSAWTYSDPITLVGKDSAPPDVLSLTTSLLATDRSTVLLSWGSVSAVDLAGYRVRVDSTVIADLIKVQNFSYTSPDEISHVFSVVAVDNSGNESLVPATSTITPIVTPSNVTNLTTSIDETDRRKINISWTPLSDSDVSGYEVSVDSIVVSPILQSNSYVYTATTDSIKTITVKSVSVRGVRSAGSTTTATPFVTPSSVTGIAIAGSVSNKNYISLSWNSVTDSDLAQYEVRVGDLWSTATVLGRVKTNSINYNVLSSGTYKFFVATINNAGNYSTPTAFISTLTCEPSNVSNFSITQDPSNRNLLNISWDSVSDTDLAQYEIRVGSNWASSTLVLRTKNTKISHLISSSGTYNFLIKTINASGFYSSTATTNSITVTCEPVAVSSLSCSSDPLDKTNLIVSWSPLLDTDISQYEVRVGTVWETATLVEKTKSGSCKYKVPSDGTYTFLVKAITVAGFYGNVASTYKSVTRAPSNVSNITVSQDVTDSTLLNINWSSISDTDLAQYEIRVGSSWSTGTVVGISKTISMKYNVSGSGTYTFRVKAINNAGFYSATEATRTVTLVCEPSDVTGLTVAQEPTDTTLLRLSWTPVSSTDLALYEIRLGTTWGSSTLVESTKTCSTSYRVSSSGTYNFLIKAVNNAGKYSVNSESEGIAVVCEPTAVSGLSFSQNSNNRSILDISWNSISDNDLSNYEIRVGTSWSTAVLVERPKATKYQYSVSASGSYTIWVASVNNAGFYSTPVSYTGSVTCEPSVVSSVYHVQDSVNKKMINLYWTAPLGSDISGYEISRDNVVVGTAKDVSYRDSVSTSGTYNYSIRAVTIAGFYSTKVNYSVTVSIEPYDVTGFTASQLISDHSKVRLSWDTVDISDLSHYNIKEGSTWESATIVNDHAVGTYLDITISEERTYKWWIKAVSTNGTSSSTPASFSSIFSMNPSDPSSLLVETDAEDRAEAIISWVGITDLDLLEYEVKYGGTEWSNATLISKTRETKIRWNPPTSGSYVIRLKARNNSLFESSELNYSYMAKVEPSNVSGFVASQNGDNVLLVWNKVDDVDVTGYEVREGATFLNGQLIATGITGTTIQFAVDTEMTHRYHIKAINRAGKYSQESSYASVTIANLTPKNVVNSYNEITLQTGTKTNVEFGESNITFATLGGLFSDYADTKFSDIGGETVLKLQTTNIVPDYHFNNNIDTTKWKQYNNINGNITKNSNGNLLLTYSSTATSGVQFYLGTTLERGATYICEFSWRTNKVGTNSGFLNGSGSWGGCSSASTYSMTNTANTWQTVSKEFTISATGTDPISFMIGYGAKVSGDWIEIEYLKIYKKTGYYPTTGTYVSNVKDMGQVITANISCEYQPSILYSAGTSAILEYRISKDNISWDAWKPFIPIQATFRYVQIRITLGTNDTNASPEVNKIILKVDVPDKDCVGSATISTGGTVVNYGYTYWSTPFVVPVATEAGKRAEIVSIGNSSFTAKVVNALTGTDVGGSIVWHSKGY